jgi:hypothetical protein
MMANAVDVGRRTTNKIGCRIAISKLASFSCRFIFQSSIGNWMDFLFFYFYRSDAIEDTVIINHLTHLTMFFENDS